MRCRAFRFRTAVLTCLLATGPVWAQVPPDEAWRTVETEHFRVTFPEHLGELGGRAATLAEYAYRKLTAQFRQGPPGPIDLVLTDHVDASNGFARIWPSNRIVLYARPPADDLALAYFDEWLELLITHELAHVFHLDYGGTLGRIFRALFGRALTPLTFPGTVVPGWVVEGLATWYESALTGAGRVHGTFHQMVLRTAALEGRFESIGQAGGNSPQWPGGVRRYAYGSLFFDYLLDKYGRDGMAAFVEAVARPAAQLPLPRLNAAGRRAFGASLSSEWTAWANEVQARLSRLDGELAAFGPISEPEALTRNARYGLHPMVSPDGSALIYVRSDGRSYPRLVAMAPDGGDPTTVTRINNRGPFDVVSAGEIVFAQRDYADRYRVFSDLYVATIDGAVRRVTEGARLTAPSAGPEGTWAVAVTEGGGTNGLARVDLLDGTIRTLVAPEAGTYWAYPAVSPDGRWVAASRWAERRHDVVILDAAGRVTHEVTRDRALDLAPRWNADGRYLVWSSDRTGIPNILGAEVDPLTGAVGPPVMLTNLRTGAAFPSVDPAGEWLYFSGYHVDGWEVERVRFAPGAALPAPPPSARFDEGGVSHAAPAAGAVSDRAAVDDAATGEASATRAGPRGSTAGADPGTVASTGSPAGVTAPDAGDTAGTPSRDRESPVRDYSPFSTLYPRYWLPVIREPLAIAKTSAEGVEVPRTEIPGYAPERVRRLVQRLHRAVACVPDGQRAWGGAVLARPDTRRPRRSGRARGAGRVRSLRRRCHRPAAGLRSVGGRTSGFDLVGSCRGRDSRRRCWRGARAAEWLAGRARRPATLRWAAHPVATCRCREPPRCWAARFSSRSGATRRRRGRAATHGPLPWSCARRSRSSIAGAGRCRCTSTASSGPPSSTAAMRGAAHRLPGRSVPDPAPCCRPESRSARICSSCTGSRCGCASVRRSRWSSGTGRAITCAWACRSDAASPCDPGRGRHRVGERTVEQAPHGGGGPVRRHLVGKHVVAHHEHFEVEEFAEGGSSGMRPHAVTYA